MLRNANSESEILLGNTQLIGIFFLLAVLLGVAFTAGFMLGHGSFGGKKIDPVTAAASPTPASDSGARTAVVEPAPPPASAPESKVAPEPAASPTAPPPGDSVATDQKHTDSPKAAAKKPPIDEPAPRTRPGQTEAFAPQPGQTFLQVAAELHDSAASAASVLNKAGFNTHVVLAPGGKLFRVLVGPVKDKNDLAATRDALKAKGFQKVIVRNY
ncbi:MAG: SPOR domain-containing protein [Bryobacteraceae bacterium]